MRTEIEHPIIYSTPMVEALLDGRKTNTRRIIKQIEIQKAPERFKYIGNSTEFDIPRPAIKYDQRVYHKFQLTNNNSTDWILPCPYGKIGDTLWVRESFYSTGAQIFYKADIDNKNDERWKPSIHMPRSACRILLEITNIRVERLNFISFDDAVSEGIEREWDGKHYWYKNYLKSYPEEPDMHKSSISSFMSLWEMINGVGSWNTNPWVWVIEFKQITK